MLSPAGNFGGPPAGSLITTGKTSEANAVACSELRFSNFVREASRSATKLGFASFASSAACACSPCAGDPGVTREPARDEDPPAPSPGVDCDFEPGDLRCPTGKARETPILTTLGRTQLSIKCYTARHFTEFISAGGPDLLMADLVLKVPLGDVAKGVSAGATL